MSFPVLLFFFIFVTVLWPCDLLSPSRVSGHFASSSTTITSYHHHGKEVRLLVESNFKGSHWLGYPGGGQQEIPQHDRLILAWQFDHFVESGWWFQRISATSFDRPLALRVWRRPVWRWHVCTVGKLGQHLASVGFGSKWVFWSSSSSSFLSSFCQHLLQNYTILGSWFIFLFFCFLSRSGKSTRRFEGHTDDVLSVAFSPDNRQIMSGSRDKTMKLWNTLAQCKYTLGAHDDWVSCVRFLPNYKESPVFVSAGWDKCVKTWYLPKFTQLSKYTGHTGYLNCVTVSPDGSLCASGGKDFKVMLWDLNENKHLYTLDHKDIINAMCFSPNRYVSYCCILFCFLLLVRLIIDCDYFVLNF